MFALRIFVIGISKVLETKSTFCIEKNFPIFKKVQSVPFDDKHCASSLLLFRIGCLNFVFP